LHVAERDGGGGRGILALDDERRAAFTILANDRVRDADRPRARRVREARRAETDVQGARMVADHRAVHEVDRAALAGSGVRAAAAVPNAGVAGEDGVRDDDLPAGLRAQVRARTVENAVAAGPWAIDEAR